MARRLVPADFEPPERLDAGAFRLRILGPELLAKDYESYMSSIDHLKGHAWGPDDTWPEGCTIEDALVDVCYTWQCWLMRSSFTYAVLDPDERLELGCIYVLPCVKTSFDATLLTWVRQSELGRGFDGELFAWAKSWVAETWPFTHVACPGREVSWHKWSTMEEKPL